MAHTRRTQILFEPDEYSRLEAEARHQGTSVPELVRRTVVEKYPISRERRLAAVERIRAMKVPLPDWDEIEEDLLDARSNIVF